MDKKKDWETKYHESFQQLMECQEQRDKLRKAMVLFRERENNLVELAKKHKEYEDKLRIAEKKLEDSKKTITSHSKRIKSLEQSEQKSKQKIQSLQEELKQEKQRNDALQRRTAGSSNSTSNVNSITRQLSDIISGLPVEMQANVPGLLKSTIETFYPSISIGNNDDVRKKAIAQRKNLVHNNDIGGNTINTTIIKNKNTNGQVTTFKPPSKRKIVHEVEHDDDGIRKKEKKGVALLDIAHSTFKAIMTTIQTTTHINSNNNNDDDDTTNSVERLKHSIDDHLDQFISSIEHQNTTVVSIINNITIAFMDTILNCAAPHPYTQHSRDEQHAQKQKHHDNDTTTTNWFDSSSSTIDNTMNTNNSSFLSVWCSSSTLSSQTLPWLVYSILMLDEKITANQSQSTGSKKRKHAELFTAGKVVSECAIVMACAALSDLLYTMHTNSKNSNTSMNNNSTLSAQQRYTATGGCACATTAIMLWRTLGDTKACHAFFIDCIVATLNQEERSLPLIAAAVDAWPEVVPQKGSFGLHMNGILQYACLLVKNRDDGCDGFDGYDGERRLLLEEEAAVVLSERYSWSGSDSDDGDGGMEKRVEDARQYFSKFCNE